MNFTKKAAKKLKPTKKPSKTPKEKTEETPKSDQPQTEILVKFGKPVLQITFANVKMLTIIAILLFLANICFSLELFSSSIKTRNHLGYFINMISKGDGEILPSLQAIPVLIFLVIDFVYAFLIYKLFSRKKQSKFNSLLFLFIMIGIVFMIVIIILMFVVMAHIYGSHEHIHDGITKAMELYSNNTRYKKQMDRLQIEFQCCGSKKYDEWYNITWYDKSLMKKGTDDISEGNTPFSCCAIKTNFPCIHHNIEKTGKAYLYTPELNLSVSSKGCLTRLKDKKQEIGWFIIGNLMLYIILQLAFIIVLRFLQTAHSVNLKFLGHSCTYTSWLIGKYVGENKNNVVEPPEVPPIPPELMD